MYREFYRLEKKPFDLTPNPEAPFLSEAHEEALAILRYGVMSKKGFLLLTGDVGTGKTTMLQVLINSPDMMGVHLCLLSNPTLSVDEFYYYIAGKFGFEYHNNKARFLEDFTEFLHFLDERGERALFIVDEAHALPTKLLEEVRLLSNQDRIGQSVLSIFLVGQPELNQKLAQERLLPLRQRIGIRFHLKPFSEKETASYIQDKLGHAGAKDFKIFTDEAVRSIYRASKGTPRLINILCDHALLSGFAESKPVIGEDIIRECVRELHAPGDETVLPVGPSQRPLLRGFLSRKGASWATVALVLLIILLVAANYILYSSDVAWLESVLPEGVMKFLRQMSEYIGGNFG